MAERAAEVAAKQKEQAEKDKAEREEWRKKEEERAQRKLRKQQRTEAMEVDEEEEEDSDEFGVANNDVLVDLHKADMDKWRERVVDVREMDRLKEKEEKKKKAAASTPPDQVKDGYSPIDIEPSTSRGRTEKTLISQNDGDEEMGEDTENEILGEGMEEGSQEENEAIILDYCQKNNLDPSSHKHVVALTASLIKLDGQILQETVFERIDLEGEWLPDDEIVRRKREKMKSSAGQGVKNKGKKQEKASMSPSQTPTLAPNPASTTATNPSPTATTPASPAPTPAPVPALAEKIPSPG